MNKAKTYLIVTKLVVAAPFLANSQTDSVLMKNVDEVVVSSSAANTRQTGNRTSKGAVASIDEHLSQLQGVDMIRRGSYAWEPVVNGMQTERVSTTIDGMKIFPACTDRMDPVTSYVESGNLQRISLNSGLDGNPQATGNIGGALDLKLRKAGFADELSNTKTKHEFNLTSGYENNGKLQVYGADAALSAQKYYGDFGIFYRKASNYKAGKGETINYSQFSKINAFANLGWQPTINHFVEATFIADIATNVGYPALNMDVASAKGIITSLSYRREHIEGLFGRWESKLYYNRISHNMDDTHRPNVVIHMDMPGLSNTVGFYSLAQGYSGVHAYQFNVDLYRNVQFADMTMYPIGSAPMYMVTWPNVATLCGGLAVNDYLNIGEYRQIKLSAKVAWQQRNVRNNEGLASLRVYWPSIASNDNAWQGRASVSYHYQRAKINMSFGAGLGNRTPSTTESFGYFINNTFDRYDYIGNPNLKNESAVEFNATGNLNGKRLSVKFLANAFLFSNYIVGVPDARLSAMTLGAAGVKLYKNLSSARVANASLIVNLNVAKWLLFTTGVALAYGADNKNNPLPLISPVTMHSALKASYRKMSANIETILSAAQKNFSEKYGEEFTESYGICNVSVLCPISIANSVPLSLRAGVENLFDKKYTTYSDWNHIPQKGRNVYINLSLSL